MKLLNNDGYRLITKFEGFSSKPYLCPAKLATIGYGNTYYLNGKKVTLLDTPINEQEAFSLFKVIADKYAKQVSKLITHPINQNQFNALVSLAYNIGMGNFGKSTLLKKVNLNAKDESIKDEFLRWNKVNKIPLKGLTNRRNYEADIYFS